MKVFPINLLYSREHTWVRIDNDLAIVGITDYAQEKMGEIFFIELTNEDSYIERDEPFGNIESIRNIVEVVSPLSGEVVSINEEVIDDAGIINSDPYDTGWLVVIKMKKLEELDDLIDAREYHDFVTQEVEIY
ncbi:MAG: glycine cleavage system protein GcvH [Syntrophales bacterium]|nr:glycine cleavage system protein GcvH [Syntrophales bacterium]